MAEVKNSFMRSKMNKDLDDRLLPNGEYRDAVNVSINKSQGDGSSEGNVGTLQTVLGNERIIDFSSAIPGSNSGIEVIGVLPEDSTDTIYAFLTNNILSPYVPQGAVGINYTYPNHQNSLDTNASISNGGTGYSNALGVATTNITGSGFGLEVDITTTAGVITGVTISDPGSGYNEGDELLITGGDANATVILASIYGPITITNGGTGYNTTPATGQTTGGSGSGLTVSVTETAGVIDFITITNFGGGYQVGDTITVSGGNNDATFTVDYILPSFSAIVSLNPNVTSSFKIIVQGPWLNFSTQAPITGVNLLEELLFFTDNRNQPRKVNVNKEQGYYTTEDQISVAKYYPFESIQLYQPSLAEIELSAAPTTGVSNTVSNSKTITLSSAVGSPPANLGVIGTAITNPPSPAGTGYVTATGVGTIGGNGTGLTVDIIAAGPITNVTIANPGSGYINGDVLNITGGNGDAQITVSVITSNTFVTDISGWPTSVIVNQPQTLPAGMDLYFVDPETTMQSADEEYLPGTVDAVVATGTFTATNFDVDIATYQGVNFKEIIGHTIYLETAPGIYTSTGATITNASKSIPVIQIVCTGTSPILTTGDVVKFAVPNPYYDSDFSTRANIEYLSDKFVRFSYRFKFDDGEYSLMAPFTQPCFIPEQDGYFLNRDFNDVEGLLNDEENAYRSTEVSFMENKVNKIFLNIPLPSAANQVRPNFKVTEIDIIYKESDKTALKVVETIPVTGNIVGDSDYYVYEYGSKSPFKTLPEREITRVFDKVPVKALSQEVASNRIIYGNYQDKHTPPTSLDYTLGATPKANFFISKNEVDSNTSSVEYPNATLKQNRDYEVGIVLSDKFGRQSTPIFSKQSIYSSLGPFLASAIYSPYRGPNENTPIGGIKDFDGNSLKIQFNDFIRSTKNETLGTPGLYNGDQTSSEYNPLGWYSFKVVVKQTEQEYYNVYIPSAMACYPLLADREKELENTSHIILLNDNINKVPRDLTEVGPAQREFRSSVRMFGRVTSLSNNAENLAFYPEKKADISTNVATIKDLFDYEQFSELVTTPVPGYLFYNFDYINNATDTNFPDSSSLIARISTQKKFGVQINPTGANEGQYINKPALNVYEIAPVESLLDIYWETSTSGTIENLNQAIEDGPAPNQFAFIDGGNWILKEDAAPLSDATESFQPVRLDGTAFPNPSANTCEIVDITSLNEPVDGNIDDPSIPYFDNSSPVGGPDGIFGLEPGGSPGSFKIVLRKPGTATALSASTSTGITLDVNNVTGSILPGSVVSGSGITPGTKVVSYSAPTVTFDQNVNITAINIPLEFGADAPGLVFRNESGDNQGVNNYSFVLRFNNPDAGAPVDLIYQAQARLINVPPKDIEVVIPKTTTSLCSAPVPNQIPQVVDPVVLPGNLGKPIADISAFNGSSTLNLDKVDLSFNITNIQKNESYSVGLQEWEDVPQNQWPGLFYIDAVQNSAVSPNALVDRQLFAGISAQEMVEYQVTIQAFDGEGITSSTATCYATFVIRENGFVTWDGGPSALIGGCPSGTAVGGSDNAIITGNDLIAPSPTEVTHTFVLSNVDMLGTFTLNTANIVGSYSGPLDAFLTIQFLTPPPLGTSATHTVGVNTVGGSASIVLPTTGEFPANYSASIKITVGFLSPLTGASPFDQVQASVNQSFCDVSL
jgi:hypothetical protein